VPNAQFGWPKKLDQFSAQRKIGFLNFYYCTGCVIFLSAHDLFQLLKPHVAK